MQGTTSSGYPCRTRGNLHYVHSAACDNNCARNPQCGQRHPTLTGRGADMYSVNEEEVECIPIFVSSLVYRWHGLLLTFFIKPLKICHVPRPRTNSASASSKTVQRRASVVETLRQQISGGERDDILRQKKAEMQRMGQEERETIAQEAGLKIEVTKLTNISIASVSRIGKEHFRLKKTDARRNKSERPLTPSHFDVNPLVFTLQRERSVGNGASLIHPQSLLDFVPDIYPTDIQEHKPMSRKKLLDYFERIQPRVVNYPSPNHSNMDDVIY
ncbi:predicted protein [Nematostella vectensis]|uniref:Uncharacterized protein n=1 Tax=Nematostella vectensis TaxID=45351 RepID=A7SHK6_NEMVE|nr:predicted protein [Nematostella vectensis]|eukprot:XP_001628880.1 predicted protein [Nematostella vectensis]